MNQQETRNKGKGFRAIADALRQKIEEGRFPEGSTLPSVRALAAEYNVSPQTVSNATALLQEDGLVLKKRGSGIRVCTQSVTAPQFDVGMMVDSKRSQILQNIEDPESYHSKDIYLAYMIKMNRHSKTAGFVIYDRQKKALRSEEIDQLKQYKAFIVQGSLPLCYQQWLSRENIPTVLINREVPEKLTGLWGQVLISESTTEDGMNYLRSLGHRHILFVIPSYLGDPRVIDHRYEKVCRSASRAFGAESFKIEPLRLVDDMQENIKTVRSYLQLGYTASFGFNDIAALKLSQIMQGIQLRIPEDFSVIGFDDIFASSLSSPPLTTIRVPRDRLIANAFDLLERLQKAGNRGEAHLHLSSKVDTQFIIRKSAGNAGLPTE